RDWQVNIQSPILVEPRLRVACLAGLFALAARRFPLTRSRDSSFSPGSRFIVGHRDRGPAGRMLSVSRLTVSLIRTTPQPGRAVIPLGERGQPLEHLRLLGARRTTTRLDSLGELPA